MAKTKLRKAGEVSDLRVQVGQELTRLRKRKDFDPTDPRVVRLQSAMDTLDWTLGLELRDPLSEPQFVTAPLETAVEQALRESQIDKPTGIIGRLEALDWRIKAQLTVAFAALVIIPFWLYRDKLYDMGEWGYAGAFLVNGLSNATIVLPAPGSIIIALMAEEFNPLLIGIAAGIGGALGGMTSYFAGAINTTPGDGRWSRFMRWIMLKAGIPVLFLFSAFPLLPGDIASIVAGGVRYPKIKYLIVTGLGNIVKMAVIAYAGLEGLRWLQQQAGELIRTNPFSG